jgi:thiol-disulfide isomerase/thioredoxin
MKQYQISRARSIFAGLIFAPLFCVGIFAQGSGSAEVKPPAAVKVTQIDAVGLKRLLKPNGKPLVVNFWATWCEPCREEFPDLVKIDTEYKGKIDFVTVSLDDLAEINRDVPKFLSEMRAEMPAYLLKTVDENAAIAMIAKDWRGGLPFTIVYSPDGTLTYFRQGKIFPAVLRTEIDKRLSGERTARPL